MMKLADKQLKGSFPPLVTPFKDDGSVDYDTYAKLVEFQVKGGTHGIVVTGTTGEPSILTTDERIELVKVAVSAAKKRIQVVAATGAQNHADTVKMTEAAEKAGADALLIVTPYFIRPPARGLEAYYLDLCKRTDLPVMIYHIPGRAAVTMTADSIARIAEGAHNLVGVKHAVTDLALVSELIMKLGSEFRIHVGLEELSFPMVCLGAHGLMNAVGNLLPGKIAELYDGDRLGRSRARPRAALRALRDQRRDLLRHQSDPDEIHDEAARHHPERAASPADGALDARAARPPRRRASRAGLI